MELSVDVITGIDKTTKKNTVIIKTDNPYLNTIAINSYKTDAPKRKPWGVGAIAGYGLTLNGTPQMTPFIGVGISRNIFCF
jgi:hypothetical protein